MDKQYVENREKLFKDIPVDDVLSEFDLKTLKTVQSMGNTKVDYENWFQALHDMAEKCRQTEFDVAILGCGAYGFPLAAKIKRMGKIAIHLGV